MDVELVIRMSNMIASMFTMLMCQRRSWRRPGAGDDSHELIFLWRRFLQTEKQIRTFKSVYFEKALNFSDKVFLENFRLRKSAVEKLLNTLGPHYKARVSLFGRTPVPLQKVVLMSIWFFANLESFRQLSDRFGWSRGHCFAILQFFVDLMELCRNTFITWPQGAKLAETKKKFDVLRGPNSFPDVVGCIDGLHVRISTPHKEPQKYMNRKKFASIILQAVCDSEFRFTNVVAGWPGSLNGARVFKTSSLGKRMIHGDEGSLFEEQMHILGGQALPLLPHLVAPYKSWGPLGTPQAHFNKVLQSTSVVINQAFARLIGRFQRMKYLEVKDTGRCAIYAVVACMLHNLALETEGGFAEGAHLSDMTPDDLLFTGTDVVPVSDMFYCGQAYTKRDKLCSLLYQSRFKRQKLVKEEGAS